MNKLVLHLLCWIVTGMLGVEEQRFNVGMICLSVDAIYNYIIHSDILYVYVQELQVHIVYMHMYADYYIAMGF